MRRVLVIVSVAREAEAIAQGLRNGEDVDMVVSGVGRTNAAATTTEAILRRGPYEGVINAGIAGALPGSELKLGSAVLASACVYAEEGVRTPGGFVTMDAMGFALGDFAGNAVPVSEVMLEASGGLRIGPIATVATCSGTDDLAREVAQRTGALAEAMEGAAVVHAARRLKVPAIELRAISNTTGERGRQQWDMASAFAQLADALPAYLVRLRET